MRRRRPKRPGQRGSSGRGGLPPLAPAEPCDPVPDMRVVSLVPGATETLFALGLGGSVVGVTHECDHPPEARRLPAVTRSNLELDGLDGGGIEASVGAALASGQALYSVDSEAIQRLEPDLVVAQDVCD